MTVKTFIDLTHSLSSSTPTWDGSCGFALHQHLDRVDDNFSFTVQNFEMSAGIGTHIDAPAHGFVDGLSIDQLDIKNLISPCVSIDVSDRSGEDRILTVSDIESWENKFSRLEKNVFVFINNGWSKFFMDRKRYRNNLVFPSVSKEAAAFLLDRGVSGLGIDTLSPDLSNSNYDVHRLFLGAGKFIIENVANLHQLPPLGATMIALPIKITNGTEAPVRLIAMIDSRRE